MSGVDLAGVLPAHRSWTDPADGCMTDCDWKPDNADYAGIKHDAHVADAIAAHIGAVLDGLREDAAEAMAAPIRERVRANGYTFEVEAEIYRDQSDAVLGVVRAAMGLEAASQPAQGTNRAAGEDECHQGADDGGEARP